MHWTERQRARVAIGLTLRSRGWHLYGFHEDRSDAMTDYYAPASWDGVAEKDGYIVVVDVSKSNNYVLSRSGGRQTQRQARGDDCTHCQGSGLQPDGWTYEQAQADPRGFNRTWTGQGVALLPDVVSPLHFDGQGRQKCTTCSGQGHAWKLESCVEPWPTFGANPPSRLWHVEKDDRILASGVGLGPCADYDSQRAQAAVEQIVSRIEDAMYARPIPVGETGGMSDVAVTIRRNQVHNGIEVVFAAKPAAALRSALKALGFRWSQRQGLWYARHTPRTWEKVHDLLGEAETPEQSEPDPPGQESPAETEAPHYVIEEPLTGQIIGGNGDEPDKPEPWRMTRLAYQESRAMRVAGGVPVLNARDGREHEASVRRAVDASLPVPPEVLAGYGPLQADIVEAVDVYDRKCRISRHDLESGWEQIRLYCDTTDKLLADLPEWHAARKAQGGATTIHRDNVAQVLAVTLPAAPQEMAGVTSPSLADAATETAEPPPTKAMPEAAVLPQPTSWTILTGLKWKNGHPVAPHGIIKAHNGDGKVHQLTPWAGGLWCMTCSSESCPAVTAVLATRPAPKGKGAQAA